MQIQRDFKEIISYGIFVDSDMDLAPNFIHLLKEDY